MRLLVCGTREWPGTWEDIGEHLPDSGDVTVIHGACSRIMGGVEVSVDTLAAFVARGLGFHLEAYPVDHQIDGPWPAAGPRRNARMLADGKPDSGLAFGALWKRESHVSKWPKRWKHTGTGDMVSKMLAAGLPVRWVSVPRAEPVGLETMSSPLESA